MNRKYILRILKVMSFAVFYSILVVFISAVISFILPVQSLHQYLDLVPSLILQFGFLFSVLVSASILAYLMIKLRLKAIDSIFISVLLVLSNNAIFHRDIINIYEQTDSLILLIVTPIVVLFIFKNKNISTE